MTDEEKRLIREDNARLIKEDREKREAAAKVGKLYRVTVHYTDDDGNPHIHHQDNLFLHEMKTMRENIYSIGLMTDYSPGIWLVIPPGRIGQVFVSLQKQYKS
jgi:hypothetical protein